MSLRRAASYNQDRGSTPLSSTSFRFNFNHLFSPPPSPSLPALAPRLRRRSSQIFTTRPSRLLRRLFYHAGLAVILYCLTSAGRNREAIPVFPSSPPAQFDMIGQDTVPDFPTPIVVSDRRKQPKWTVSIPHDHDFPLSINEYAGMNSRCREVLARVRDLDRKAPLSDQVILTYDSPDNYFVDVYKAERTGLLFVAGNGKLSKHSGHFVGMTWESTAGKPVCASSLTFVIETPDAGLGGSLMTLWTLYALAKEQGRAFIDDSRWAYGAYADMFRPPPVPDCWPSPRHHMVPCPVQARHLVVSSSTAGDVLPALLAKHRRATGADGSPRDLLELARIGYKVLFALTKEDQGYVDKRVKGLRDEAKKSGTASRSALIIGLHIRRGDRHPLEYQYRDTYIPADVVGHVQRLTEAHYKNGGTADAQRKAVTVIATDDPMVHKEADFLGAQLAQQRIRLATKEAMEPANPDSHVLHPFVEESQGWEGGLFARMLWNLGAERKNNAAATALSSDSIVCVVSVTGCRLLGVMMGWERAMDRGGWANVDGGASGWSGLW